MTSQFFSLVIASAFFSSTVFFSSAAFASPEDGFDLPENYYALHRRSSIAHFKSKAILKDYLLPLEVKPLIYEITLYPNLDTFLFDGKVVIKVVAQKAANTITLHSLNQTIQKVTIKDEAGYPLVNSFSTDIKKQFLILSTEQYLILNEMYTIEIIYNGTLNHQNLGFYKASYLDEAGHERWLATTHFEPTRARIAFPCFDEPALKAKFKLNMVRNPTYNSIFNTKKIAEVKKVSNRNGVTETVTDIFEETPQPMSTYLVAFVNSDFDLVASEDGKHEVYATPAQIADGRAEYALSISEPTMKAMEDFTGILNYDMGKMTQIAIPDDWFAAGAMENWGLVTYKARYIMYKEGINTASEKQRIASIIAHEYSHQWFGNLVSPAWWTYIWLNEGFATYFKYYGTSKVETDWRAMEQFVVSSVQYAMARDSNKNTREMSKEAVTPVEIKALFDSIAYDKSGSVIRMMEHFLGTDIFKEGVHLYLDEMKYSAAHEDDLWRNLQIAAKDKVTLPEGQDIAMVMKTWSLQAGYPVITVKRSAAGQILITQRPFFTSSTSPGDRIWSIPFNYATADDGDFVASFADTSSTGWLVDEEELAIEGLTLVEGKWIIFNKQQTGYYRVNYDETLWKEIVTLMKSADFIKVPPTSRAQLIDDAFKLAVAKLLPITTFLDLAEYIREETDYIPLYSFMRAVFQLNKYAAGLVNADSLKKFVATVLRKAYEELGTSVPADDGHINKLNRVQVLNAMCRTNNVDCQTKMNEAFKAGSVVPDLQAPAYCGGMMTGTEEDLQILLDLYADPKTEELQKARIITGMGCAHDEGIIGKLLSGSVTPAIRERDRMALISSISTNSGQGLRAALDHIDGAFDNFTFAEIIFLAKKISARAVDPDLVQKVRDFAEAKLTNPEFDAAKRVIEGNLVYNEKWMTHFKVPVDDWLLKMYGGTTPKTSKSESGWVLLSK